MAKQLRLYNHSQGKKIMQGYQPWGRKNRVLSEYPCESRMVTMRLHFTDRKDVLQSFYGREKTSPI